MLVLQMLYFLLQNKNIGISTELFEVKKKCFGFSCAVPHLT